MSWLGLQGGDEVKSSALSEKRGEANMTRLCVWESYGLAASKEK